MRIAPTATSEPDYTDSRRKLRVSWIIAGAALLIFAWFVIQLFGPNRRIIVSKETTFITEPLGEEGLPDFSAYILKESSEGVTPENNAAVLTWQALWPGDLAQEYWLPMANALGLKKIPSAQDSLVRVHDRSVREEIAFWLVEQFSESLDDEAADKFLTQEWQDTLRDQTADELIDEAMNRPWTSEQIPALGRWAENNQQQLDMLVEASTRPYYFSPSPSHIDGSDTILIATLLPGVQGMRSGIRALSARAMWHLGEGRDVECWQDVLACHRLARLVAQGNTLVEQLVGIAIDGMACRGTITLLHHGELKSDLTQQIFADLNSLPSVSSMARSLDQGERLTFLDAVIRMSDGEVEGQELVGGVGGPLQAVSFVAIDWNLILREGNRWYDRFVAAMQIDSHEERRAELQKIDSDLLQLSSSTNSPGMILGSIISRRQRSRFLANVFLSLFLPSLEAATHAEDRGNVLSELTRAAAALAVYRAEHSEYPEELAALAPEILSELPVDLYSGKQFIYERKDDGGYLLYSVFENGIDDGGTDFGGEIIDGEWIEGESEGVDYNTSDLVIRVPVPAFELPEPPQGDFGPR